MSGLAQRDTRRNEEAACSADYDKTRSASSFDALNKAVSSSDDLCSLVGRRPIGGDDSIRPLDDPGDLCRIAEVTLDYVNVLEFSDLGRGAGYCGDGVPRSTSSFRKWLRIERRAG